MNIEITKKSFLFSLLIIVIHSASSQTFYDNNGEAKYYFDKSKETIFSFTGEPLGYFKYNSNYNSPIVYSFNGNQLGWYKNGVIYSNTGKIDSYTKASGVTAGIIQIEPIKGIQGIIPIKGVESIPMIEPIFSNSFNSTSIFSTNNNSSQSNNQNVLSKPYSNGNSSSYSSNDYSALNYKPYKLPVEAITNAFIALNQRHAEMTSRGYIINPRTGDYIKKEDYIKEEKGREEAALKSIEDCLESAEKKEELDFSDIKKGWYKIYGFIDERGCVLVDVRIQKNTITWIKVPNTKSYDLFQLSEPLTIKGKTAFKNITEKKTWYSLKLNPVNAFFFYSLGIYKK